MLVTLVYGLCGLLSVRRIIQFVLWQLPKICDMCHNKNVKIFTAASIKRSFPSAIERVYEAGQVVVYHGDKPDHVMFIKSGAVKFYDTDVDGNEKILHIGSTGSFFPLFFPLEDKDAVDAFYATITKTEVIMVPLSEFRDHIRASADYSFQVLRWYVQEVDHIVLRLKSMEKSSAKQRLLHAFYYLCSEHAVHKVNSTWCKVNFPLTQQILADLTGLTRETVNVTLKDTDIQRLVKTKHQVYEINEAKVRALLH